MLFFLREKRISYMNEFCIKFEIITATIKTATLRVLLIMCFLFIFPDIADLK